MDPIGKRRWAIPEGWMPEESTAPTPALVSHETACILNAGDENALLSVTAYGLHVTTTGKSKTNN